MTIAPDYSLARPSCPSCQGAGRITIRNRTEVCELCVFATIRILSETLRGLERCDKCGRHPIEHTADECPDGLVLRASAPSAPIHFEAFVTLDAIENGRASLTGAVVELKVDLRDSKESIRVWGARLEGNFKLLLQEAPDDPYLSTLAG